jgi:glycosyltransferase involved in cell wall biosynthesis
VSAAAARDSRITFTGAIEEETKDAFYDRIDLLVVPSEGEENAPLVVAEASVRGIPAVVSDRGGLAESPLAAVIPGGDAAALAATLDRFDVDRAEVRSRSRALLANADEYSWGHHVEQVVAVLERARVAPRSAITPLLPARRAVRPASASWSANRS